MSENLQTKELMKSIKYIQVITEGGDKCPLAGLAVEKSGVIELFNSFGDFFNGVKGHDVHTVFSCPGNPRYNQNYFTQNANRRNPFVCFKLDDAVVLEMKTKIVDLEGREVNLALVLQEINGLESMGQEIQMELFKSLFPKLKFVEIENKLNRVTQEEYVAKFEVPIYPMKLVGR